jgi:hypothetical protein
VALHQGELQKEGVFSVKALSNRSVHAVPARRMVMCRGQRFACTLVPKQPYHASFRKNLT